MTRQLRPDGVTERKMGEEEEEKEEEEEEEEEDGRRHQTFPRKWFLCVLPQDTCSILEIKVMAETTQKGRKQNKTTTNKRPKGLISF